MSENENKIQKEKLEHVALTQDSSKKIGAWIEQISFRKKGLKISRKHFVNWLIEKMPENLSSSDLASLIEKFFDEQKLLRLLLRESAKAKAEGRKDTGFEIVVKAKRLENKPENSSEMWISGLEKARES
ncbi:MAG: hypothetical protein AAB966_05335 [Patescibacteria group bacterium]